MPTQTWTINERDVSKAITTAIDMARARKISITVAVVNSSGLLLGQSYMDGAKLPSTHVAVCKAWTSAMFQRPSGDYAGSSAPGGGAYAIWNAFPGNFVPVGGGAPITYEGICIGAVGVSGGTADDDAAIAASAAEAIVTRVTKA